MGKAQPFKMPIGRFVQGDPFTPNTKDQMGNQKKTLAGADTQTYFMAVAYRKGDPAVETIKRQFEDIARSAFPEFFPNAGPCTNPNFSFKIIDGDGFDQNGKPNGSKEGFAGCWIFKFSSQFAPECYVRPDFALHQRLKPEEAYKIPRGHYVTMAGTVNDNKGKSPKPGLFVNLQMVAWERGTADDIITSGPDAQSVFGDGAPVAATGPVMLGGQDYNVLKSAGWSDEQMIAAGHMQRPVAPPPAPPPPPPAAVAPPPPPPPPVPLASGGSVPPPPPAPIAVAAPGYRMTEHAGATSYADYIKAQWTDAMLVQNNFMVPL